jgi:prolipoprotein diacylglyceryltransferase
MFPKIVTIPGIDYTLGIRNFLLFLGIAISVAGAILLARRLEGLSRWRVTLALMLITVTGLFAGRVHFEINNGQHDSLWSLLVSTTHLLRSHHAAGALIGIVFGAALASWILRIPLGKLGDLLIPAGGFGYAVVRLGCYAHGCCTGILGHYAWCIAWPRDSITFLEQVQHGIISDQSPHSALVHPLQLYFVAMGIGMSLGAILAYRRKAYDGEIALAAIAWFGGWSAFLELFRADFDGRVYVLGQPQLMWVALAICLTATTFLIMNRTATRRVAKPVLGEIG